MKKLVASIFLAMAFSGLGLAQKQSDARQELPQLLRNFLDGAAKGDKAAFERFFAEDVIYTRAVGAVLDRAAILQNISPPAPGEPVERYDADEIVVHQSGDVAILNFRLAMHTSDGGKESAAYYRNTGTFQLRNGEWKVIAWQATPIPEKSPVNK